MAVDKLVDSTQLDSDLTSVANAIRAKSGGSGQLAFPAGFVSEIGNIVTGGGADLLASSTATENVTAFKIDFTQEMADYDAFMMEIEGTATPNNMYICPQVNTTDRKYYWGNTKTFHRYYWVVPMFNNTSTPGGWLVAIGASSNSSVYSSSSSISYFYIRSYYDTNYFETGTTMKVWGVKL